jgi:hypothetical protein
VNLKYIAAATPDLSTIGVGIVRAQVKRLPQTVHASDRGGFMVHTIDKKRRRMKVSTASVTGTVSSVSYPAVAPGGPPNHCYMSEPFSVVNFMQVEFVGHDGRVLHTDFLYPRSTTEAIEGRAAVAVGSGGDVAVK